MNGKVTGTWGTHGRLYCVRLVDGEELRESLDRIAKEEKIEAGAIVSGIGGFRQSRIRVPVVGDGRKYIDPGTVEVTALQGTVSRHGCHLHVTVADQEGRAWGGHVSRGCVVRLTFEVVIVSLSDVIFKRELDETTGFKELEISRTT